jgi:hypothetical protein
VSAGGAVSDVEDDMGSLDAGAGSGVAVDAAAGTGSSTGEVVGDVALSIAYIEHEKFVFFLYLLSCTAIDPACCLSAYGTEMTPRNETRHD